MIGMCGVSPGSSQWPRFVGCSAGSEAHPARRLARSGDASRLTDPRTADSPMCAPVPDTRPYAERRLEPLRGLLPTCQSSADTTTHPPDRRTQENAGPENQPR